MAASLHLVVLTMIVVLVSICIFLLFISPLKRKRQIKRRIFMLDAWFEKRAVIIPQLIAILQKHVVFDDETLKDISALSKPLYFTSNRNSYLQTEEGSFTLKQILVQMHDWPELKSDKNFLQLKNDFFSYEEEIEASRQFLEKFMLPDIGLKQSKNSNLK